uniref:Protein kinase domain-containing protein n=1 Tax=Timspurckia oligopyrenoides TaxID=708627 RepID=A0A7S0ZFU0_9RHOD|mmetsp:Transcript_354/g.638  ORF Transcript_354/g.638 Transcript_354/m.638 type:complete len:422 (+) Transcript_354:177-1442(+)|eukprot:CAMPEP_0182450608 /NCGR_PEP_ID=MMETSP1172-20130603/42434_1 /TAXON_ID=708627 /ORGANISM="Timspurckia oligopyrenoides, Strain CCMP3278" /LENGTH=421 /DNA_ID=CAMNT_0024648279 /DNA_START=173 /DNA_END=1438 /DNA_ORIENTATION=+
MNLKRFFKPDAGEDTASLLSKITPAAVSSRGYRLEKKLHEGGQGVVFLVSRNSDTFALKVFQSDSHLQDALTECNCLSKLRHHHILSMIDYFRDDKNIYVVFEFCAGGDLYDQLRVRRFSEVEVVQIAVQLFSALEYMHGFGIAHRDLKPENLAFTESWSLSKPPPAMKLIDFGLSIECEQSQSVASDPSLGTVFYLAPEIIKNERYDPFKADVWSAGIMMYSLLARRYPFESNTEESTKELILRGELFVDFSIKHDPPSTPEQCSPQMKKLLQCLLKKTPEKRPSAQAVHLVLRKLLTQVFKVPEKFPLSSTENPSTRLSPTPSGISPRPKLRAVGGSFTKLPRVVPPVPSSHESSVESEKRNAARHSRGWRARSSLQAGSSRGLEVLRSSRVFGGLRESSRFPSSKPKDHTRTSRRTKI